MTGMADEFTCCRLLGDTERVAEVEPTMAGEDFAFYGDAGIPSTFVHLGIRDEKKGTVHGLHTSRFLLDEDIMPLGAAYHAALATEFLDTRASKDSSPNAPSASSEEL